MKLVVHRLNSSKKPMHAAGATLGQEHLGPLRKRIQNGAGEIVIVDFSGIESATASYLKATIVWLIQSARLVVGNGVNHGAARGHHDPIPLSIYPVVAGLAADVREELDAVLPGFRLPCLETLKRSDQKIQTGLLHGPLDQALLDTLRALTECGSGTASSLHQRFPDRKISTTGWNNRLADLHMLRLAMRRKEGRQWLYESVAAEVKNGRES
jgi:hypothetical protein